MIEIGKIVYLEFNDFPTDSHEYLWTACRRYRNGKGKSYANIKDPRDTRYTLIEYDSVPKSTLEKYKIPLKEEFVEAEKYRNIEQVIKLDTKDVDYYLNIPKAQPHAAEYADIAAWHKWCASDAVAFAKEKQLVTVDELYETCIVLMNRRGWRKWKIRNLRKFKDSIKPFKDAFRGKISTNDALQSLISDREGLQNAAKLLIEPGAQALLIQLYGDAKKLTYTQTYIMFQQQAVANVAKGLWTDKAIVTEATIENFLKRPDIEQQCYMSRHGHQAWRRKYDYINKRIPASFANAKWVIDGTQFPLYYQEGKNAYARLNVFVVLDEHSWCVVGFMIAEDENSEQVIRSLHMACKLNGVMPYQIQYDNSKAIQSVRSQMVIQSIAKYGTATQVGNARAKVIEPFFKQLFLRILRFEYGNAFSPVMGKTLDSAQNRDALQYNIKNGLLPQGRDAAKQTVVDILNAWNSHEFKGASPLVTYKKSMLATKEHQREFTHMMEVDAFWEMPGKIGQVEIIKGGKKKLESQFKPTEYTFTNWGIRLEVDKVKHDFDLTNAEWLAGSIGEKFNIKYDPATIDSLYLYKDGKPVCTETGDYIKLSNKDAKHSALVDHTDGEMQRIKDANAMRENHRKMIVAKQKSTIELTKQDGTYTPITLGNMYPKEIMNAGKSLRMEEDWRYSLPTKEEETPSEEPVIEVQKVDRYGF